MFDIYLWGSYLAYMFYFFVFMWTLSPFYSGRKKGFKYVVKKYGSFNLWIRVFVFFVLTTLVIAFGSAYRPKNKLPQVRSSEYGKNRVSTEIKPFDDGLTSYEDKVKVIQDFSKRQEEIRRNLIKEDKENGSN